MSFLVKSDLTAPDFKEESLIRHVQPVIPVAGSADPQNPANEIVTLRNVAPLQHVHVSYIAHEKEKAVVTQPQHRT